MDVIEQKIHNTPYQIQEINGGAYTAPSFKLHVAKREIIMKLYKVNYYYEKKKIYQ